MLDEQAFDSALADDADGALVLGGPLVGADSGSPSSRGAWRPGSCSTSPAPALPVRRASAGCRVVRPTGPKGDLDLDASLEPLSLARAGGTMAQARGPARLGVGRPVRPRCAW